MSDWRDFNNDGKVDYKKSSGVITTWEGILFFVLKLLAVGLLVALISVHSQLAAVVVLILLAPFLMES